jgi:hypothetical protein
MERSPIQPEKKARESLAKLWKEHDAAILLLHGVGSGIITHGEG